MPFDGRQPNPREDEILDTIRTLERAREIVRRGWSKDWLGANGAYCAASALVIAVHGEPPSTNRKSWLEDEFDRAVWLEEEYNTLRCKPEHPAFLALKGITRRMSMSIPHWNDTRRDANEVIAGFDKAINNLRDQLAFPGVNSPVAALATSS